MTVSFDENVQERDCIVLFKFNRGKFDICMTVIEVVQELHGLPCFYCRTR